MLTFAQLSSDAKEAGGVLIGRHIIGTDDVVIDKVTKPSRSDRRTWASFHRARKYHQDILDEEWRASGGTRVYLGEWHTHPEPVPAPSTVDMTDWQRRLRRDLVEASFLFFLIVGQSEVRAWEGSRSSFGVAPLRARSSQRTEAD
jgi:integrative and conjugative element protein (TIGR02256 family)